MSYTKHSFCNQESQVNRHIRLKSALRADFGFLKSEISELFSEKPNLLLARYDFDLLP
jgi:hypothetical protein